jgi:DNA-binding NarL/FixJ family response regulator
MGVSVVLVDDHRIVREGLRLVLQKEPDLLVVGEASGVRDTLQCVRQAQPDVVVMDLHLPDGSGIDAARSILAERPQTRVLILSADSDLDQVRAALRAGVRGYLLKDAAGDELVRAVRAVLANQVYLCPAVTAVLVEDFTGNSRRPVSAGKPPLSERELQVLKLVVEGLRNKEMAVRLGVSVKTVETYRSRLMRKLGRASTAELVRSAVREGLAVL